MKIRNAEYLADARMPGIEKRLRATARFTAASGSPTNTDPSEGTSSPPNPLTPPRRPCSSAAKRR